MKKLFLIAASFFGATAVMLGAFATHGLRNHLAAAQLATFQTGVHYQILHAIVLLSVGILVVYQQRIQYLRSTLDDNQVRQATNHSNNDRLLDVAGIFFIVGILLFSGSLYLLSLWQIPVGIITPIGGLLLICGWIMLAIFTIKLKL